MANLATVWGIPAWAKDFAKKEIGKERSVCSSSDLRWQHGWTRSLEDVRCFVLCFSREEGVYITVVNKQTKKKGQSKQLALATLVEN